MCGIYGIWSEQANASQLDSMGALLRHRGPDHHGTYSDPERGLWLGMERLAIVDLSDAANQPMIAEDGQVVVIFNGEIFNFLELRRELEERGHRFTSHSDTEVLLRGYLQWGDDVVQRLYGMFAFALWDARRGELVLVRDATGIKPLFYRAMPGGGLAFASESKAFFALGGALELDAESVTQYLEFGYVWDSQHSMLAGTRKLPPGCRLRVRRGLESRVERWWHPPAPDPAYARSSLDECADELLPTLERVVQQHLIADVPLGLLLSGGLDSSVLAALAARHSTQKVRTWTIGFEPSAIDERAHAREVVDYVGTEHREIVLQPRDVLRDFREMAWFYDDLFWDTGFISSLSVYRVCRTEQIKVVLVGEGADELFGGYRNFRLLSGRADGLPDKLHRYLFFRQYSGMNWGRTREPFLGLIAELNQAAGGEWFSTVRLYELQHQIPNNLNMKVDHASMANSVEARVPYQDRRVVELLCRMPREQFLHGAEDKLILRHMARRHRLIPAQIAARPKLGMMMPGQWLTNDRELFGYAAQLVLARGGWAERIGYRRQMQAFFDGHERRHTRFFRRYLMLGALAWRLFVLELWQSSFTAAEAQRRLAREREAVGA